MSQNILIILSSIGNDKINIWCKVPTGFTFLSEKIPNVEKNLDKHFYCPKRW